MQGDQEFQRRNEEDKPLKTENDMLLSERQEDNILFID